MRKFKVYILSAFFLVVFIDVVIAQNLIINEVMSSNQQYLFDADNDTPDWIELYNSGTNSIDLANYSISDKIEYEKSWIFPTYQLGAGEYIFVFASGKDLNDSPLNWNTLISEGDNWHYLIPSNEPSANWKNINYNDSNWNEGPSGFGYGDDDDNTTLSNVLSVFIRKTFTIESVSDVQKAMFHIDYDDAFVAYINGTEIARANISSTGAPAFNASANNSSHEARMYSGGQPDGFEIENIQSLLVEGENVLAVQIHNVESGSSDLTAIPFLSFGYSSPQNGELAPFITISQKKFHTNFSISASGESLYIFKQANLIDSIQVPELPTNVSYGRNSLHENSWFYYNEPTPEKNNTTSGFSDFAGEVTFSRSGGIYQTNFRVILSSQNPEDRIYYTTDKTEPTESDQLYTSPIKISETTMLRAVIINENAMPGYVSTQSYFFNIQHDLPVISLVTDPDNFFSYEKGIYVYGSSKPSSGENCDNGANFWQDWEVPVHVSMIETDGNLAFEQNAGVKIFGGCSRNNAQKSLSLRFRKRYGKEGLNYKVFDDLNIDVFHSLNLRSSGNDWNQTMFRDGLQTHLFPESVDKTAFRPAVVYINGEYWGIHNIRERIDENYIASHHQIDPDLINIMEFHVNWLVNLVEGDDQHYLNLLDFIENNDLSDQENYEYVSTQMDVENFALYQAANICIKNTDWPGNNVKYWQSPDIDMKWRWITFDTDFGFTDYNHNTLTFALAENGTGWPNPAQSTFLLRQLNKNQEFRNIFINAFADELNTLWDEETLHALIDKMKEDIATEIPDHFNRWGGNANNWSNNTKGYYSFATKRPEVIRNFVQNYYGISGTFSLNLMVNNDDLGEIKLNAIKPKTFPWYGLYFKNVPITLTALPKPGCKFVQWEGSIRSTEKTIQLTRNETTTIKAVFEKDESLSGLIKINEIFYSNPDGESPRDWIELYNPQNIDVDISGWKLKDSNNDHEFSLRQGATINKNDYLIICKDTVQFSNFYALNGNIHGNFDFGLSSTSDYVRLYDSSDYLIDSVAYSNSNTNPSDMFSYQLIEKDELPAWNEIIGKGTPLAVNKNNSSSNHIALSKKVKIFPNPFETKLMISFRLAKPGNVSFQLISQNGTTVRKSRDIHFESGDQSWTLNKTEILPQGIYILIIQTSDFITSKKVVKL